MQTKIITLLFIGICRIVVAVGLFAAPRMVFAYQSPLGENPNFSRIPITTEESVGEIVAITQDYKGFIWIAGSAGVARYDGYRFHTYGPPLNEIANSFITDVYEDSQQTLWIVSTNGSAARLDRERDLFRVYQLPAHEAKDQRFDKIYEDEHKNLWFVGLGGAVLFDRTQDKLVRLLDGTVLAREVAVDMIQVLGDEYLFATSNGVFLWDRSAEQVERFSHDTNNPESLPNNTVRAFSKDAAGNVWLGHGQGLCRFVRELKTFDSVKLEHAVKERKDASVWRMFTDTNGILWLGTDGNGLMYFDPVSREFGSYTKNVLPSSLGTSVVRSIFQDNLGDFWIGGYPSGLFHYNGSNNFFAIYANFIRDKNEVYKNHVWAFTEDELANLWLGVDGMGLVYFDRKANTFTQSYQGFDFADKEFPHTVLSMLEDSRGNLWLGSWAQGVTRFNLKTKKYQHFNPRSNDGEKFVAESVWDIEETSNGDIYFATMNSGFIRYNYASDKFTQFARGNDDGESLNSGLIWSITETQDGLIWLATFSGINVYDPATGKFHHYFHDPSDPQSLSSNSVNAFMEDSKGRLWITTLDGGLNLYHPQDQTFTHIGEKQGLIGNDVQTVVEDNQGVLWLASTKGVSSFDPNNGVIKNYTHKNWLQDGAFSRNSALKLKNGNIAFGGDNGFNVLAPERVTSNTYSAPIYITELAILNHPIDVQKNNNVLNKDIVEADKIVLTPDDTMVTLSFTSLNYRIYDDNQYKYKLQGLDSEWHFNANSNRAVYTHLPSGKYRFLLMASNNHNIWGDQQASIDIIVLPSPWRTWWAYCVYVGAVLSMIGWYIAAQRRKIRQARALNNRLIELDQLKDDFLANTSHELKTPLNGIIGITQALQSGSTGVLSSATQQNLGMILSCGRRLERLIGNILDFSKSKSTEIELELSCENIAQLISEVLAEVKPTMQHTRVDLINRVQSNLPFVYCDAVRTQQIFYNIIANAIKFTEEGVITVTASVNQEFIEVSVEDTGIGIADDRISQLYSSFTQLAESGVRTKNGTGLSLAMSKYFVDLQNGKLSVISKLGIGSTFTVALPKASESQIIHSAAAVYVGPNKNIVNDEPLGENQMVKFDMNNVQSTIADAKLPTYFPSAYDETKLYNRILVVDDESINRMVLREILLKNDFIVDEACNGQALLDAITSGYSCDLILLDIMMPKVSGIDACRQIREKYSAEELPIIFISAKSKASDMLECLQVDGNDFLSKPVHREDLLTRIEAHVKLSQINRQRLTNEDQSSSG